MISVCIITKNESENLERCLECISRHPFDIVVVDTGSSDNSVDIAKKYTNNVHFFKWCDDFSAARNYAASLAKSDTILMVDTDEFLENVDYEQLDRLAKSNVGKVGRVKRDNIFTRNGENEKISEHISRLYDKRYFTYEGRIHEQIVRKDGEPYEIYHLPASFAHTGYDGSTEAVNAKADRNIKLLLKEYEINPHDPYILYQLGKSYYMKQDFSNAEKYFEECSAIDLDPKLEYVSDMIVSYGYTLVNNQKAEIAISFENMIPEFGHLAEYRFLMGIIYMNNMEFDNAIDSFVEATKIKECSVEGANSYKAYYNIGVIKECLGYTAQAREFYQKCGSYDKALSRLSVLSSQ